MFSVYVRHLPCDGGVFQRSHGSVYLRLLPAGGRSMKLQLGCVTALTDQSKLCVIRHSIKSNNFVKHNLYFELYYALSVDVLLLLLLLLFSVTECGFCKLPLKFTHR